MDYSRLIEKKRKFDAVKDKIDRVTLSSYEKDFELTFVHNSTAIEGNTLTLLETKVVLEDGVAVGGKALREIYEVVNHKKAYGYVKKCIADGEKLDENKVKDIHEILTENIMPGGIYRNCEVRISGAGFTPPSGMLMFDRIKAFFEDLKVKQENVSNAVELAAWAHAEFVSIHPFADGNGRASRLIMNYILMSNGFLPVSVAKENRLEYYKALEEYAVNGNIDIFSRFIAELEEQRLDEYLSLNK